MPVRNRDDSMKGRVIVPIAVVRARGGRRTRGWSELDASSWPPGSMARVGIHALHQASLIHPISTTLVSSIRGCLNCLVDSADLLRRPTHDLVASEVAVMLRAMQSELIKRAARPLLASKFSTALRALLSYAPDRLKDGSSLQAAIAEEAPRLFRRRHLPRNHLPPALGHVPHEDLEDLRKRTLQIVRSRQQALEHAIADEIERYERTVTFQNELLGRRIPRAAIGRVKSWLELLHQGSDTKAPSGEFDELLASILQILARTPAALDANGVPRMTFPSGTFLRSLKELQAYQFRKNSAPWFQATQRLPNVVLTSIFLLLLSETGWNIDSVGSLTIDRVNRTSTGGYRIQGYKAKTDDDTPVVDIHPSQQLAVKGLDLLIWNQAQLRSLGLLDASDRRLWFGWQRDAFEYTTDFVSRARVEAFCSRHALERFAPSSLRPLAAAATYLPQRDLEAVRVLLGHRDLRVTDGYLRDTLFWRMNESNILQYQRRIETTLTFWTGGSSLVESRKLNASDVDPSLIPSGDGGACAAPRTGPPTRPVSDGSSCPGFFCQEGAGCPNYRLLVTPETLEMALRTQRYYKSRWAELYRINPATFAHIHLQRLLYIHVLLAVVEDQRPDLLSKARGALA